MAEIINEVKIKESIVNQTISEKDKIFDTVTVNGKINADTGEFYNGIKGDLTGNVEGISDKTNIVLGGVVDQILKSNGEFGEWVNDDRLIKLWAGKNKTNIIFNGNQVWSYVKKIASLPDSSLKMTIPHDIRNIHFVMKIYGFASNETNFICFGYNDGDALGTNTVTVSMDNNNIYLQSYKDLSIYKDVYVIFEYIEKS